MDSESQPAPLFTRTVLYSFLEIDRISGCITSAFKNGN